MFRYTTPTITIEIPDDIAVNSIDKLVVTLKQGNIKLEKTEEDVTLDTESNSIIVTLSQEETGLFATGAVFTQCHILVGDTAYATNIMRASMFENLHNEVLE